MVLRTEVTETILCRVVMHEPRLLCTVVMHKPRFLCRGCERACMHTNVGPHPKWKVKAYLAKSLEEKRRVTAGRRAWRTGPLF
jgi:hypothetical protein